MEKLSELDSFWPAGVQFTDDLTPAAWIGPRLMPWGRGLGTRVGAVVPTGYPAYVRILHPLGRGSRSPRWRELAADAGITYHPLLQWERLPLPLPSGIGHQYGAPATGTMASSLRRALLVHLAGETSTPDSTYYGIWEGSGLLHGGSSGYWYADDPRPGRPRRRVELMTLVRMVDGRAKFALPARNYLLAHGKLAELVTFPDELTPSLVWPEDQAFCCATEIDFDSTLVGLSEEGAQTLLDDEGLEALPVNVEDRLDIDGDILNQKPGQ